MRSTERVDEDAIKTYEDLGKPQFRGKLCLRTSNNEYNQSFVADLIAKHGAAARRSCCAPGWTTTRRSSAPTSTCSRRSPPAAATSG